MWCDDYAEFSIDYQTHGQSLSDLAAGEPETIDLQPVGYALDRKCPDLVYVPGNARANILRLQVCWTQDGREQSLLLQSTK